MSIWALRKIQIKYSSDRGRHLKQRRNQYAGSVGDSYDFDQIKYK